MKAYTLTEFLEKYFESPDELAKTMGVDRNTVYRNCKKGVIVIGDKSNFTTYHPKITITNGDPTINNQLSLLD